MKREQKGIRARDKEAEQLFDLQCIADRLTTKHLDINTKHPNFFQTTNEILDKLLTIVK